LNLGFYWPFILGGFFYAHTPLKYLTHPTYLIKLN
jgi:hypothetical protein